MTFDRREKDQLQLIIAWTIILLIVAALVGSEIITICLYGFHPNYSNPKWVAPFQSIPLVVFGFAALVGFLFSIVWAVKIIINHRKSKR